MLSCTYYAQSNAGIIHAPLVLSTGCDVSLVLRLSDRTKATKGEG